MLKSKRNIGIKIRNKEIENNNIISNIISHIKIEDFQYYPKFWAERSSPFEDELLSSWMSRTAIANLITISEILSDLGFHPYKLDLDLNWNQELIELFVKKTGVSEEKLHEMSLIEVKNAIDNIYKKKNTALKVIKRLWITSWQTQNKNGLRYCPLCLQEDKVPYFRKEWRLNYITFCSTYNCFLENKCPVCKSPIALYRIKWDSSLRNCYKCGADLSKTKVIPILTSDTILTNTKSFLMKAKWEDIFKVLSLAWFIACYCSLNNVVFNSHPLIKDKSLINFWNRVLKKKNKISIFSNISATFY